jgi:hypothetical protein
MTSPLRAYIQSNDVVDSSKRRIIAVVTDDVDKSIRDVTVTSLAQLKATLRATITDVHSSKELDALTPGTEIDLSIPAPPPPPPPPDPTPDDLAVEEFLHTFINWRNTVKFETVGITGDPTAESLQSAFVKLYLDAKPDIQARMKASILLEL